MGRNSYFLNLKNLSMRILKKSYSYKELHDVGLCEYSNHNIIKYVVNVGHEDER